MNIITSTSVFLGILQYRDIIEIIVISIAFYYYFKWIDQLHISRYTYILYGCITSGIIAFVANCTTLLILLCCMSVVITTALLVNAMHFPIQKTKNHLSGHAINKTDWITMLIQGLLHVSSNKLPVIIIIERDHTLNHFLTYASVIECALEKELLQCILLYEKNKQGMTFLVRATGLIKAINCSWLIGTEHCSSYELALQNAIIITHSTDSLVLIRATAHTFTIVNQGLYTEALNPTTTIRLLKKLCFIDYKKESFIYEPPHQQNKTLLH